MDLTDDQWALLQPLLPPHPSGPGRPWADDRAVLDGILWVMRTASPWRALPPRYPSYQTCHRRCLAWRRSGLLDRLLCALYLDLRDRGRLDLSRCFQDGRFVYPRLGAPGWECLDPAGPLASWQLHTALVFLVPLLTAAPSP